MPNVIVSGAFDDLRSRHVRFLEQASRLGAVHVVLWSDEAAGTTKFPIAERKYLLHAVRYVDTITVCGPAMNPNALPLTPATSADMWVVDVTEDNSAKESFCHRNRIAYRVITEKELAGFPGPAPTPGPAGRKKVIVTGCFDWLHSGHVRFFEEVSQHGDLHVVVGSDANVRLLKGPGHPLFKQDERRYMVGSMRFVRECWISSGKGWMDAEPEIYRLKPDLYAVNEDGDNEEKREFCRKHGLHYLVLRRTPREGLTARSSTRMRGY